ncbi:MAG TPA: hypothetical protein V6D19_17460 [Stenomitos sp.]
MRTLVALMWLVSLPAIAQVSKADIGVSHIEANVPEQRCFDTFLKRDLLDYFRASEIRAAASVEYELLRDGPTQSGVSYPKYYLWVKVHSKNAVIAEGAVRVAAIDQKRFEVTNFLSRSSIQSNPNDVDTVFPSVLVPSLLLRAGVK